MSTPTVGLLLGDAHPKDVSALGEWLDVSGAGHITTRVAHGAGLRPDTLLRTPDASDLIEVHAATLAVRLLMLQSVTSMDIDPVAVSGFGVGQLAALAGFGAIRIEEAAALVAQRARALVPRRRLCRAEVDGIDHGDVIALCRRTGGRVIIAEHRSPSRHVVVGPDKAMDAALEFVALHGGRTIDRADASDGAVGVCSIPALVAYRRLLRQVQFVPPTVPVMSSVSLTTPSLRQWPDALGREPHTPAFWAESATSVGAARPQAVVYLDTDGLCLKLTAGNLHDARALRVAQPSDVSVLGPLLVDDLPALDRLVPEGETIAISERLVVSPATGVYRPRSGLWIDDRTTLDLRGLHLRVGDLLGEVAEVPVQSTFDGTLMKIMAWPGERVRTSQPIAWLRAVG